MSTTKVRISGDEARALAKLADEHDATAITLTEVQDYAGHPYTRAVCWTNSEGVVTRYIDAAGDVWSDLPTAPRQQKIERKKMSRIYEEKGKFCFTVRLADTVEVMRFDDKPAAQRIYRQVEKALAEA